MNPQVEKYLAEYQAQKREEAEKEESRKNEDMENKKAETLIAAGLYTVGFTEISAKEFLSTPAWKEKYLTSKKDESGVYHYYNKKGKIPIQVTDEEYEAILATNPTSQSKNGKRTETDLEGSSFAKGFFKGIAWILWIGGLLLSIVLAIETESFSTFFTTFIIYFIGGCVALCFSELFSKLQAILSELKKSNELLSKGK